MTHSSWWLPLCREEIDRLGGSDRVDVLGIEMEQSHESDDLALEIGVLELARDDAAHGDVAVRCDGELQHQLALQLRVVTQRAGVEAVDAPLVLIEHQLDLLARARSLTTAAARCRACVETGFGDAGSHRGRFVTVE